MRSARRRLTLAADYGLTKLETISHEAAAMIGDPPLVPEVNRHVAFLEEIGEDACDLGSTRLGANPPLLNEELRDRRCKPAAGRRL